MKVAAGGVALSSLLFSSNLCLSSAETNKGGATLIMATSPDYPPFEFHQVKDGKKELVGFDVELARAISAELNYELKIVEMSFAELLPALRSGKADFVMAGLTPTPERLKTFSFTDVYFENQMAFLSKHPGVAGPEHLVGMRLSVQRESTQEEEARLMATRFPSLTIVTVDSLEDAVNKVRSGEVNAALLTHIVAAEYSKQSEGLWVAPVKKEGPSGSAIAFAKESPLRGDFNKVLQKMKESGELESLIQKWFGLNAATMASQQP